MEENKTNNINNVETIDLRVVSKKLWGKRWLFCKVLSVVLVISCIYILGFPRYYTSDAKLAPEMGGSATGSIGSIASAFGFDLSSMESNDAIYPTLYPDLMEDNGFVAGLFGIKVVSQDGTINTTYHGYLQKHQKISLWSYPIVWIKNIFKKKETATGGNGEFNPYILSKAEDRIAEAIRANVMFSFNEKTGVVTIKTKAQDPLICKTLADSVTIHLQNFITEYRTNKARIDYEYYKQLATKAKQDYERVRQKYANMADASTNLTLRSVEMKLEDVENDMQLKFNAYTTINTQLEAAKAKVQERTPAFTTFKGAAVPTKAAGPKRVIFVLFMLIFATLITMAYVLREEVFAIIAIKNNK